MVATDRLLRLGNAILDIHVPELNDYGSPTITVLKPSEAGWAGDGESHAYTPAASIVVTIWKPDELDAVIDALIDIKTQMVERAG